jgi:hypothetical protein
MRSTLRRDALRAQFPTLLITREAAHAFAATAPRDSARCFSGTLRTAAADKLPFRALRIAQLHALGVDISAACFVAELLLPLAPCAAAGAERLLMDAARFLVQNGLVPTAHLPEAALLDGYVQLRASRDALADLGFFLHTQLRAAEASGQPLQNVFSFSGRTLTSVTRLAAQHRREALVAAVATSGNVSVSSLVGSRQYVGDWRILLTWDAACTQMLALRCSSTTLMHADMRWPAGAELICAESYDGYDDCVTTTLRGEWHMRRLRTWGAMLAEGREQHNCLRYEDGRHLSTRRDSSYWSLRFTPDATGQQEMEQGGSTLQRSVASLRLTVLIAGGYLRVAYAPRNEDAPLAALQALTHWGRHHAEAYVPQFVSLDSYDDYQGAMSYDEDFGDDHEHVHALAAADSVSVDQRSTRSRACGSEQALAHRASTMRRSAMCSAADASAPAFVPM